MMKKKVNKRCRAQTQKGRPCKKKARTDTNEENKFLTMAEFKMRLPGGPEADAKRNMYHVELYRRMRGLPDVLQHILSHILPGDSLANDKWKLNSRPKPFPGVFEAGNNKGILAVQGHEFLNWGMTVRNRPRVIFFPRTRVGVCNIVKWAASQNLRVRCAAYRHTWTDLYGETGHVLICLLPLHMVEDLPADIPVAPDDNDFTQIVESQGHCRVGASVTNEQFRRWCEDPKGGNQKWCLPSSVVMVEVTLVGTILPMCHGAGLRHQAVSDLVTEIEFVNARGEIQVINQRPLLLVAAGSFGLIGIVTSVTVKLQPMTFAVMKPIQQPLAIAIPLLSPVQSRFFQTSPFPNATLPAELVSQKTITTIQQDQEEFEKRCLDYYSEWFWFPYQKNAWVHTWNDDGLAANVVEYPSPWQSFLQWGQAWMAEAVTNSLAFGLLSGHTQGFLFGTAAMTFLPDVNRDDEFIKKEKENEEAEEKKGERGITALLSNALHFRRGIANTRVRDFEAEIPIPALETDSTRPDWTICNRAFWDAIALVYASPEGPMRVSLEMRITGGSPMILAPQHGNRFGTCAIEVLTTQNTPYDEWKSFMQRLLDVWTSYKDAEGRPLNVRLHWCKEWQNLQFRGKPILQHYKEEAYATQLPLFRNTLMEIEGSTTTEEVQKRFSNPLLDQLIFL